MRRRDLLGFTFIVSTTCLSLVAVAEQTPKPWRIGNVTGGGGTAPSVLIPLIRQHLTSLGYVEGRDITIVDLTLPTRPEEREQALRKLIPQIDLLAVWSTIGAVAAKNAAPNTPTVFMSVGDPVRVGLVQSLSRPGGNMTGITFEATMETYGKRLQVLKEIVPDLKRVAVLCAVGDVNVGPAMAALEEAARGMDVSLLRVEFAAPGELDAAFASMKANWAEGVIVVAGAFTFANRERIAALTLTNRLPSSHGFSETVAAGGLVSIGPDFEAMARQGAAMIGKIMAGIKPADIPVEQPVRYKVAINQQTARTLGLTIPAALLASADEVIE